MMADDGATVGRCRDVGVVWGGRHEEWRPGVQWSALLSGQEQERTGDRQ